MTNLWRLGKLAVLIGMATGAAGQARADFAVAPSGYTSTSGGNMLSTLLNSGARTFQEMFFPDQTGTVPGIPGGSTITQVAFRLASTQATVGRELDFADYSVQLGSEPFVPSESFTGNITANTVTVRSGALSIAANTLQGGSNSVNPFSFVISFTTPFVYTGGILVLTVRHTGNGVTSPFLDSAPISSGASTRYATGATATDPTSGGPNPIAQFQFTPAVVPEPASATLCGLAGMMTWAAIAVGRRRERCRGERLGSPAGELEESCAESL